MLSNKIGVLNWKLAVETVCEWLNGPDRWLLHPSLSVFVGSAAGIKIWEAKIITESHHSCETIEVHSAPQTGEEIELVFRIHFRKYRHLLRFEIELIEPDIFISKVKEKREIPNDYESILERIIESSLIGYMLKVIPHQDLEFSA